MKKIKKLFENIKLKWLRETSLTILLIAIIILAFIAINLGVEQLNLTDIDLTSEQLYTLTDESKEKISKIPSDEEINIYLFDYVENSSVVDLVKQYMKVHEGITMEITTVTDRADLANQYDILEGYYSILILSGDKYKLFTSYDLYTYDYNTYETIDITEQRITNGIIAVSSIGTTTSVYSLTGHGEYTTSTYLATAQTYLELEGYEIQDLDLLVEEQVPDDCAALIICSPEEDITELEAEKIKAYINAGGNILWMNDPYSSDVEQPYLQSVLDMYGVTIDQDGIMIEQDSSKMVMQSPDLILPTISSSTLTSDLATEGVVLFLDASKLSFVDDETLEELGVTRTDILTTSDTSFYRTDLSISSLSATDSDIVGSQVVGSVLEKSIDDETTSTLVVYANNLFATDYPVTVNSQSVSAIYFYNNLDLVLNSVSYIAEIEDTISIRKTIEVTTYTATETQNRVVMSIIFGVPVVIVIVGIVVWQLRRRKK